MKKIITFLSVCVLVSSVHASEKPPTPPCKIAAARKIYGGLPAGENARHIPQGDIIRDLDFFLGVYAHLMDQPSERRDYALFHLNTVIGNLHRSITDGTWSGFTSDQIIKTALELRCFVALRYLVNNWLTKDTREAVLGLLEAELRNAWSEYSKRFGKIKQDLETLKTRASEYLAALAVAQGRIAQLEKNAEGIAQGINDEDISDSSLEALQGIRREITDIEGNMAQLRQTLETRANEFVAQARAIEDFRIFHQRVGEIAVEYDITENGWLNLEQEELRLPLNIADLLAQPLPAGEHPVWKLLRAQERLRMERERAERAAQAAARQATQPRLIAQPAPAQRNRPRGRTPVNSPPSGVAAFFGFSNK